MAKNDTKKVKVFLRGIQVEILNKCVLQSSVLQLERKSLEDVIKKYKEDMCCDDYDATLLSKDLESFLEYHFPGLKLKYFLFVRQTGEESGDKHTNVFEKVVLLASVLLFYGCKRSKTGRVIDDICERFDKDDQMMILEFCEHLNKGTVNVKNIKKSIEAACRNRNNKTQLESNKTTSSNNDKTKTVEAKEKDLPNSEDKTDADIEPKHVIISECSSSDILDVVSPDPALDVKCEVMMAQSDSKNATAFRKNTQDEIQREDCQCQVKCSCRNCNQIPDSGDSLPCKVDNQKLKKSGNNTMIGNWSIGLLPGWIIYVFLAVTVLSFIITVIGYTGPYWWSYVTQSKKDSVRNNGVHMLSSHLPTWVWICKNNFCHKIFTPKLNSNMHPSLAQCTLLCMGLQIWPYPTGNMEFSNTLTPISTKNLEYKFTVPSEVFTYITEAFKLFIKELKVIENNAKSKVETDAKKVFIEIDIEKDKDYRIRLDTDESYYIECNKERKHHIKIRAASFCGARHGIETLSQLIILDDTGYLITYSKLKLKDAPNYKYRGIMIDTARNFIPVGDLMRTIDAMAMNKLNTFHWRISDATSFPFNISKIPELVEYGPYDTSMVYSKTDVTTIVKRAEIRGIRVLIEVAAPGPVGRPWSWFPGAICPNKFDDICFDDLCIHLPIKDTVFDKLEAIYAEILELTNVHDIFHLSNGLFAFPNCYNINRQGFLFNASLRLKNANKGFLPKLPITWYVPRKEASAWRSLGVQLHDWDLDPEIFKEYKLIQSTKWDLSCEIKNHRCIQYRTWQEMYAWKSWRNLEVSAIEGGEAILWSDIVDSGNLDQHLWPRAAAVAERLWSDVVANSSANTFVYRRLESQRQRMQQRGIDVQPIWPIYCSYEPSACFDKI